MYFHAIIMNKIKDYLLTQKYLIEDYATYLKKQNNKILDYSVLLILIFYHVILRKKKPLFHKHKKLTKLENTIVNRETIDQVINKFAEFDIISFDIFDTLIFRPFEKPTDCFYLLEAEYNFLSFAKYRREAEAEARQNTTKQNGEIDIFDIYTELQKYYDISDSHSMAEKEIELEKKICYANPYTFEIYKKLLEKGKKIIAVSDMYIPEKYIRHILNSCGYTDISEIFVSCDYGLTKASGKLPKLIHEKLGINKTIIHIDDNKKCIFGCKKAGWKTYYYKQCNFTGSLYRANCTHSPVSQMYKGIVNNYLHCGAYKLNPQEEIGFAYAGISVCGYVEWLDTFCKKNNCDKILFLARDMDIFYKVYDQFYGDIPHEYVQSSRNALRQLYFEHCQSEFFTQIIDTRVNMNKSFADILKEADLAFLIDISKNPNIDFDKILSNTNTTELKKFIMDNKKEIIKAFNESNEPTMKYFKEKIGNAKKICISGLGWAGSELAYLKWLINDKWKLSVEITNVLFASDDNERANALYSKKELESYTFNCSMNTNFLFNTTENDYVSIIAIEFLFTSQETSLRKFILNNSKEVDFIRDNSNPNKELVAYIQSGIIKFIKEFNEHRLPFSNVLPISGADAYSPLYNLLDNHKYLSLTIGDFMERPRAISGNLNDNDYIPLKKLLK